MYIDFTAFVLMCCYYTIFLGQIQLFKDTKQIFQKICSNIIFSENPYYASTIWETICGFMMKFSNYDFK